MDVDLSDQHISKQAFVEKFEKAVADGYVRCDGHGKVQFTFRYDNNGGVTGVYIECVEHDSK